MPEHPSSLTHGADEHASEHPSSLERGTEATTPERAPRLDRTIEFAQISWEHVAFAVVVLISFLAHIAHLGTMAMHHDESIHAWLSWRYFTGDGSFTCASGRTAQSYCYDPVYHGPSLYVFTLVSYFLFGDGEWQARLPQALAGIGMTISMWWLRPYFGTRGTILLALAVTLAPNLLYFTRFARHDGLMVLWTVWGVIGFLRYLDSRERKWLWLMATGIGLAITTHELYYILGFLFFWFIALRWAFENLQKQLVYLVQFAMIAVSLVIEALILTGTWEGNITPSLNAGGVAVVLMFMALISLILLQLWPDEPIITPIVQDFIGEKRRDLYVSLGIVTGIFMVLYGNFFVDPIGMIDGLYQGLSYWLGSQQTFARGDQPWYYYLLTMGLHEPLALFTSIAVTIVLATKAIANYRLDRSGDTTARTVVPIHVLFMAYWFVGALVFFSWAGEKMPWLTSHISLPATILTVWAVITIARAITTPITQQTMLIPGATALGIMSIAVAGVQLSGYDTIQGVFPLVVAIGFLYAVYYLSTKIGQIDTLRLSLLTIVVLMGAYSVRASWLANFDAPDNARDPIVYTQTSPDVPRIVRDVQELAINQTRNNRGGSDITGGHSMPIIMDVGGPDGEGSLAWPFQWYFRHMQRLENRDNTFFENSTPDSFLVNTTNGEQEYAPVVMAYGNHINENARSSLDANYVKLYDGYLNWWFPEGDKCNPTGSGYKRFYYSSLSARKALIDCPSLDETQLPSLLAPVTWPLDTSHWSETWRYLMYRELPDSLSVGGRELQVWVRRDLAGGGTTGETTVAVPSYKIVADRAITFDDGSAPRGIAIARDGSMVVSDPNAHNIRLLNPDGSLKLIIGERGNGENQFNEPRGVAIGPDGEIFVADTWNARIVKLSPEGEWIKSWGAGTQDFGEGRVASVTDGTLAGNQAVQMGFFGPRGVAVSNDGFVYIADTGNKRIVVTDLEGTYITQWGEFGSQPGQFNEPIGVAVDVDGTVVVGDTWNGRVQVFASSGDNDGSVNPMPIQTIRIRGWQAQTYDDPYVAILNGRIVASIPTRNQANLSGIDGLEILRWGGIGSDNASFNNPSGVAFDSEGRVYVIDRGNVRVLGFTLP
ncbi:MAG: flippase activity-associated protein Agl23 [Roseiflexaceae bacterium]